MAVCTLPDCSNSALRVTVTTHLARQLVDPWDAMGVRLYTQRPAHTSHAPHMDCTNGFSLGRWYADTGGVLGGRGAPQTAGGAEGEGTHR